VTTSAPPNGYTISGGKKIFYSSSIKRIVERRVPVSGQLPLSVNVRMTTTITATIRAVDGGGIQVKTGRSRAGRRVEISLSRNGVFPGGKRPNQNNDDKHRCCRNGRSSSENIK
jgi:hypothetical protein